MKKKTQILVNCLTQNGAGLVSIKCNEEAINTVFLSRITENYLLLMVLILMDGKDFAISCYPIV